MSDKYTDRQAVCHIIIQALKNDPEAVSDFSNALTVGLRVSMEEQRRQNMVYYDGMIAALQMLPNGKLPEQIKDVVIQRILDACAGQHCGFEKAAVEKFSKMKKD